MPWQQDEADVALEYDPVSGLYRYDEVDTTVPRQSGKTKLTFAKKVHRLTVMAKRLGPQRSTYVGQTRIKARQKLEKDFAESLRASKAFREMPHPRARPTKATEWKLALNNGSENIQFGSGSYLQIDAPSRTGGHGDTLDDGDVDEAWSQEDDTVEAAMRPSMATRKNAQIWITSTAGDARSKYLYRKVLAGRAASESGMHGRVCYIDYSAPDDADPGDPRTWWACMPALGHTITEQFIQGEWERAQRKGGEGIKTFRRAYLNQWPDVPILDDNAGGGFIPDSAWEACRDRASTYVGVPMIALDVSPMHKDASITLAGMRADGLVHGLVVHTEAHGSWVIDRLKAGCAHHRTSVTLVKGTAAYSLKAALEAAGVPVSEIEQSDYAIACGELLERVTNRTLRHRGQPDLDEAVRGAISRPSGDRWVFDRKRSGVNITPLCGLATAVRALTAPPRNAPAEFMSF